MMQPSAGANYGMHFPLHAGTEVLVACMNGDPDRPIILGAMTNPATTSPVTSANASHHTVRTFAGNELQMDDLADSEKINLHTKDQKNILSLDANSDGHKLALRTEEGKAEFYAKKTMNFESGDTHTLITGNDQTITVENKHSLQTNKKDIAFNAATDIALTAKDNIKLSAEDKDISLTSGQDLIIETGKDMSVRVMDGDSSYTIQQGSVSIDAAKSITLLSEGGPISIEQGGGSVEISDGKLSIRGTTVAIEGGSVAIAGQMAEMTGGGGGGAAASKAAPAATASSKAAPAQTNATADTSHIASSAASAVNAPAAAATLADAFAAEKAEDAGRFITAAEGKTIVEKAKSWSDTPYGTGKYAGGNPVKGKGADCSGSVWAIYKEAGLSYGIYTNSAGFKLLVGSDANFIKGTHFFKQVSTPQVGDVARWDGHLAIYDPDAGMCGKGGKIVGDLWSASNPNSSRKFGAAHTSFYKEKGQVTWYRYWKAP